MVFDFRADISCLFKNEIKVNTQPFSYMLVKFLYDIYNRNIDCLFIVFSKYLIKTMAIYSLWLHALYVKMLTLKNK